MSEGSAARIDPRFDPRFQRGYVSAEVSATSPVAPARPVGDAPVPPADEDPAEAIRALIASEKAARRDAAADPATGSAQSARAAREIAGNVPVAAAGDAIVEDAVDDEARGDRTRWFWIALAACATFVVVGVALFWNAASDRSMFTAAPAGLEGSFNQFSMALAPGLVQAGTLGVVAVLVAWAINGRRSRNGAE